MDAEDSAIRDQDRLLPIANISRIMKRVLPEHAKMSKEAKSAIQECVSEFIGFITSEASDRLQEDKRKTITGDDIIDSMRALGFDNYIDFLHVYLRKYRSSVKGSKGSHSPRSSTGNSKRSRSRSPSRSQRNSTAAEDDSDDDSDDDDDDEEEQAPKPSSSKKRKT